MMLQLQKVPEFSPPTHLAPSEGGLNITNCNKEGTMSRSHRARGTKAGSSWFSSLDLVVASIRDCRARGSRPAGQELGAALSSALTLERDTSVEEGEEGGVRRGGRGWG